MDGVLIIDKPAGMTSHDVVARVRRILREQRVGHTGTLDPFATGVLVVLVGRATRLAQFLSGADKEYEAVIRLGYATDTGDFTGEAIGAGLGGERDLSNSAEAATQLRPFAVPTAIEIESALGDLRGQIEQVPPMYSAKKVGGQKLYDLARRGAAVERKPVNITIHEFEVLREGMLTSHDDGSFDLAVRVVCSAGSYIRVLAEDFGKRLGVGAHLAALRRTRAGRFLATDATTLEHLQQIVGDGLLADIMVPPDAALSHLPFVHLSTGDAQRIGNGIPIRPLIELSGNWVEGEMVRMRHADGQLLAIGCYDASKRLLHPRVVLAT